MKLRLLIFSLIISSLFGYIEWSENYLLLYQAEVDILSRAIQQPKIFLHPFTLLPFLGQIFLVIAFFQKNPNKIFVYLGIVGIGILILLILLIGFLNINIKMIISAVPFLFIVFLIIIFYKNKKD